MDNKKYIKLIIEMVEEISDMDKLICIYSYVKVKYDKQIGKDIWKIATSFS